MTDTTPLFTFMAHLASALSASPPAHTSVTAPSASTAKTMGAVRGEWEGRETGRPPEVRWTEESWNVKGTLEILE